VSHRQLIRELYTVFGALVEVQTKASLRDENRLIRVVTTVGIWIKYLHERPHGMK
jgi:hypothetical protein